MIAAFERNITRDQASKSILMFKISPIWKWSADTNLNKKGAQEKNGISEQSTRKTWRWICTGKNRSEKTLLPKKNEALKDTENNEACTTEIIDDESKIMKPVFLSTRFNLGINRKKIFSSTFWRPALYVMADKRSNDAGLQIWHYTSNK